MATAQEGGRGSLLTRLQASNLIHANEKIVYRGSDGAEFEGVIVVGEDQTVSVKYQADSLKNEAAFVRKATGDVTIPKNFKNTLSIGGRAFRDIQDEYKKLHPRPERPPASSSSSNPEGGRGGGGRRGNRRHRNNRLVRLAQLAHSGKLAVNTEAWFDSKAGRIAGTFEQRENRFGFAWNDEFYHTPAAFIKAAESSRNVAEEDRISGKWDLTLHVGDSTVREARDKFLAERPPPEPKPHDVERAAVLKRLAQIREQIAKLREEEAELRAKVGGEGARRPNRSRRPRARRPNKVDDAPTQ